MIKLIICCKKYCLVDSTNFSQNLPHFGRSSNIFFFQNFIGLFIITWLKMKNYHPLLNSTRMYGKILKWSKWKSISHVLKYFISHKVVNMGLILATVCKCTEKIIEKLHYTFQIINQNIHKCNKLTNHILYMWCV